MSEDLNTKSLGEKLAIASANDAGLSAAWADCREDVKAEFERIALAFASSLSHDETANAVITDLRHRLQAAEQRERRLREAVSKAINQLSDTEIDAMTRVLDARDTLIIARSVSEEEA